MMQISAVLPDVLALLPSAGGCRQPEGKHSAHLFDAKCFLSPGLASRKVSSQLSPFNVFLSIEFLDTFLLASIAMESLFFVLKSGKSLEISKLPNKLGRINLHGCVWFEAKSGIGIMPV